MARALWKGSIAFGLVSIPIELHTAVRDHRPKFRMLHLTYLETLFPDVYKVATAWQQFPADDVTKVQVAYKNLGTAYRSGDPGKFEEGSQAFFVLVYGASTRQS